MKFEYQLPQCTLKVLGESFADEVLDFYSRNRDVFDRYETKKPANFYTKQFIENTLRAEHNAFLHGKHVRFFMYDKTVTDKIIGTISFSNIKYNGFNSCCTGYKIDKNFQRQGYGTKMLTAALKIMITDAKMHRIEAYILPDNTPSISLIKSAGFISEGTAYQYAYLNDTWRDHLRFVYIS